MIETPTAPATETITVATKGLLFDMDGVLLSSIGSVVRCWRKWAMHYGLPNAEQFEFPHGMRAIEIVRTLTPQIDSAEALRLIEDLELEDTADLKVLPGVRSLLASLPPERWSIVTSATRRLLLGRLKVAELPEPERIIAGDDVVEGKPSPEPYRKGAELLGLSPEDCVVVEDAPAGIASGIAAGCRVLAVLGTHAPEELSQAHWIVPSLENMRVQANANGLQLTFPALR